MASMKVAFLVVLQLLVIVALYGAQAASTSEVPTSTDSSTMGNTATSDASGSTADPGTGSSTQGATGGPDNGAMPVAVETFLLLVPAILCLVFSR